MEKPAQNNIRSAKINLNYSDKAMAQRGNLVIESMFSSHILPMIEKNIHNEIPKEAFLEIPKMELEIGTISETKLREELPMKIGAAISKALKEVTSIRTHSTVATPRHFSKENFLLGTIEFYLLQGYFPKWTHKTENLANAIHKSLLNQGKELVGVLKKFGKNDTALQRLAYGTDKKLFENLLKVIQPTQKEWIAKMLSTITKFQKSKSNTELTLYLRFLILRYALNTNPLHFNRDQFLKNIVDEMASFLDLERETLWKTIENEFSSSAERSTTNNPFSRMASTQGTTQSNDLAIRNLVKSLNSGTLIVDQKSKKRLHEILNNSNKRSILYKDLSQAGAVQVLKLCYPHLEASIQKIIRSFYEFINKTKKANDVAKYLKAALFYISKNVGGTNTEEFIYFLLQVGRIDLKKAVGSKSFVQFMEKQQSADLFKFQELVKNEATCALLTKWSGTALREIGEKSVEPIWNRSNMDSAIDYFLTYRKRVIRQYLTSGLLKEIHFDLTRKNMTQLFQGLLEERDAFIVEFLAKNIHQDKVIERVQALYMPNDTKRSGNNYVPLAFFLNKKETSIYVSKLIDGIIKVSIEWRYKTIFKRAIWQIVLTAYVDQKPHTPKTFVETCSRELGHVFKVKKDLTGLKKTLKKMSTSQNKPVTRFANSLAVLINGPKYLSPLEKLPMEAVEQKDISFYVSQFQFFSQNGFLPWWSPEATLKGLVNEIGQLGKEYVDRLSKGLMKLDIQKPFLKDFFAKLSPTELQEFTRSSLAHANNTVLDILDQINKEAKDEPYQERVDIDRLWEEPGVSEQVLYKYLYLNDDQTILDKWRKSRPQEAKLVGTYTSIAPYFIHEALSPLQWRMTIYQFTLLRMKEQKTGNDFAQELLKYVKRIHNKLDWHRLLSSVKMRVAHSNTGKNIVFPEPLAKVIEGFMAPSNDENNELSALFQKDNEIKGEQIITVFNAGLILFWPFLTRFFEKLSLIKENSFLNEKCRNEAIYALQYLVYNKMDFPEHHLILNKVLVGMLPQELSSPISPLGEHFENMAQSLLFGLISNWEKVKNSSPEAIQETFLQREGLLMLTKENMYLKIDKKGVDVLLSSLPWNISLIKLPWMKKPLHVEWI